MTITNGYCTLAELKSWLEITTGETSDDSILEDCVEEASRMIDAYTGRHYYTATTQARYFTPRDNDILFIDDLVSINTSGLVTDDDGDRTYEITWATTDYDLMPINAAAVGAPYTYIQTTPLGRYAFPVLRKGVKITGTWGWSSVPPTIKRACMIQAAHLYSRKLSPGGNIAVGELVPSAGVDQDVMMLINPYKRITL